MAGSFLPSASASLTSGRPGLLPTFCWALRRNGCGLPRVGGRSCASASSVPTLGSPVLVPFPCGPTSRGLESPTGTPFWMPPSRGFRSPQDRSPTGLSGSPRRKPLGFRDCAKRSGIRWRCCTCPRRSSRTILPGRSSEPSGRPWLFWFGCSSSRPANNGQPSRRYAPCCMRTWSSSIPAAPERFQPSTASRGSSVLMISITPFSISSRRPRSDRSFRW